MSPSDDHPGLYVHLPFCSAICPYCDFYVLTGDRHRRRRFLDWLQREIELSALGPWPDFVDTVPDRPFDTLYLGGGTPSRLDPEQLAVLTDCLLERLPFTVEPWIGIEANPEDVSEASLAVWRDIGVSFLSLGVQSFTDEDLRFLGRRHDGTASVNCVELAVGSGIGTISVDLIYGLPEQSEAAWTGELEKVLALGPNHLSCYQLTIEPRTPFGFRRDRGLIEELSSDSQADLFFLTHRLLAERGLHAYEVSNFTSAPSHRSRHNVKYWQHVPYLGLGPSAHSFAPPYRWWNLRKIRPWEESLAGATRPIEDFETLTEGQLILERLLLGLRTPTGVDLTQFGDHDRNRLIAANQSWLERLADADLAHLEGARLKPTLTGLAMAESLVRGFTLPPERAAQGAGIC